jgi:NADH-quinone oxidoreductase subunit M
MPVYTIFFFIALLSSIAVPLTNGFIGEFLILLGTFQANKAVGGVAVLGVIFGAVYMLWMFKRVFFGKVGEVVAADEEHALHDLSTREIAVLIPIVVLVFWMGIFPGTFLKISESSIKHFVEHYSDYDLNVMVQNGQQGESFGRARQ